MATKNEKEIKEVKEEVKKEVKEKTYKIKIPINELNPKDLEVVVGINEKYAKITRGVETEVSEPVYEVLKNAGLV